MLSGSHIRHHVNPMSKEIKHNRRSFLGTAALSIITAKMALMDTAHASFDPPKGSELGFAPIKQISDLLEQGFEVVVAKDASDVKLVNSSPRQRRYFDTCR